MLCRVGGSHVGNGGGVCRESLARRWLLVGLGDGRQGGRKRGGVDGLIGTGRQTLELLKGIRFARCHIVAVLGAKELLGEGDRGWSERVE